MNRLTVAPPTLAIMGLLAGLPFASAVADIPVSQDISPKTDAYPAAGARFSTRVIELRIAGVPFNVPKNQFGAGEYPKYPGADVGHLLLVLYYDGVEVRGARPIPGDRIDQAFFVQINPFVGKGEFGALSPDAHYRLLTRGSKWSGPRVDESLGVTKWQYDGKDSWVYALTGPDGRERDGTYPAATCARDSPCQVHGLRLRNELGYRYYFPANRIAEWRDIHPKLRAHLESLIVSEIRQ